MLSIIDARTDDVPPGPTVQSGTCRLFLVATDATGKTWVASGSVAPSIGLTSFHVSETSLDELERQRMEAEVWHEASWTDSVPTPSDQVLARLFEGYDVAHRSEWARVYPESFRAIEVAIEVFQGLVRD
jgi:hypothetical protein